MVSQLFIGRDCKAYPPGREPFEVKVGIYQPVPQADHSWRCDLYLGDILKDERCGLGVDEWSALQAGMQMVWLELAFRKSVGWHFEFWDGQSDDVDELLPQWGQCLPSGFE
ncbi:DUF6968 family protein [Pseudoduganella lutea]|uniref:DUF6968 domain-containing protein n=1 Tax=Pseudoduganella lutea TaxID=321985 RepID=A0A4P6L060_9BURK|nr:hypothetical protein [Pseudoduganella lutea]QBE64909.1 hypothetical protein EWM63_19495 [Pseudoduganella lutea]